MSAAPADRRGAVVATFDPPHAGDHALIARALELCPRLTVCLLEEAGAALPLRARRLALEEMHPAARVVVARLPAERRGGEPGAEAIESVRAAIGERLDVVFSARRDDGGWAARLGAVRERVDLDGVSAPDSEAAVREDPARFWSYLSPAIRGELALRVVVTGSESTGKTTLARRLAERYRTVWVPEFGRELTVLKQQRTYPPEPWQPADFSWIAAEQERQTDDAARRGGPLVIADTDAVATRIWEERYLERASHATERIAAASRGDLYLLAMPDVPWVADGIRDGDQELREWMTRRIRELLAAMGRRPVELSGSWEEREERAVAACDELLARGWSFSDPARNRR